MSSSSFKLWIPLLYKNTSLVTDGYFNWHVAHSNGTIDGDKDYRWGFNLANYFSTLNDQLLYKGLNPGIETVTYSTAGETDLDNKPSCGYFSQWSYRYIGSQRWTNKTNAYNPEASHPSDLNILFLAFRNEPRQDIPKLLLIIDNIENNNIFLEQTKQVSNTNYYEKIAKLDSTKLTGTVLGKIFKACDNMFHMYNPEYEYIQVESLDNIDSWDKYIPITIACESLLNITGYSGRLATQLPAHKHRFTMDSYKYEWADGGRRLQIRAACLNSGCAMCKTSSAYNYNAYVPIYSYLPSYDDTELLANGTVYSKKPTLIITSSTFSLIDSSLTTPVLKIGNLFNLDTTTIDSSSVAPVLPQNIECVFSAVHDPLPPQKSAITDNAEEWSNETIASTVNYAVSSSIDTNNFVLRKDGEPISAFHFTKAISSNGTLYIDNNDGFYIDTLGATEDPQGVFTKIDLQLEQLYFILSTHKDVVFYKYFKDNTHQVYKRFLVKTGASVTLPDKSLPISLILPSTDDSIAQADVPFYNAPPSEFTLLGWKYLDLDGTPGSDFATTSDSALGLVTEALSLVAEFNKILHTLLWQAGDNVELQEAYYGKNVSDLMIESSLSESLAQLVSENIPENYEFTGWEPQISETSTVGSSDIYYRAQYAPVNTYQVKLKWYDCNLSVPGEVVEYNDYLYSNDYAEDSTGIFQLPAGLANRDLSSEAGDDSNNIPYDSVKWSSIRCIGFSAELTPNSYIADPQANIEVSGEATYYAVLSYECRISRCDRTSQTIGNVINRTKNTLVSYNDLVSDIDSSTLDYLENGTQYTFAGWKTNDNETIITSGESYMVTENLFLEPYYTTSKSKGTVIVLNTDGTTAGTFIDDYGQSFNANNELKSLIAAKSTATEEYHITNWRYSNLETDIDSGTVVANGDLKNLTFGENNYLTIYIKPYYSSHSFTVKKVFKKILWTPETNVNRDTNVVIKEFSGNYTAPTALLYIGCTDKCTCGYEKVLPDEIILPYQYIVTIPANESTGNELILTYSVEKYKQFSHLNYISRSPIILTYKAFFNRPLFADPAIEKFGNIGLYERISGNGTSYNYYTVNKDFAIFNNFLINKDRADLFKIVAPSELYKYRLTCYEGWWGETCSIGLGVGIITELSYNPSVKFNIIHGDMNLDGEIKKNDSLAHKYFLTWLGSCFNNNWPETGLTDINKSYLTVKDKDWFELLITSGTQSSNKYWSYVKTELIDNIIDADNELIDFVNLGISVSERPAICIWILLNICDLDADGIIKGYMSESGDNSDHILIKNYLAGINDNLNTSTYYTYLDQNMPLLLQFASGDNKYYKPDTTGLHYYLRPGINIIKFNKSGTVRLRYNLRTSDLAATIPNIEHTIICSNLAVALVNSTNGLQESDAGLNLTKLDLRPILAKLDTSTIMSSKQVYTLYILAAKSILDTIRDIDPDFDFYYNCPIINLLAIDLKTTSLVNRERLEYLSDPHVWYDVNNVNNKFVISEIDAEYLKDGIKIARSSKL